MKNDKNNLKKMNLTPIEDLISEDFGDVGTSSPPDQLTKC